VEHSSCETSEKIYIKNVVLKTSSALSFIKNKLKKNITEKHVFLTEKKILIKIFEMSFFFFFFRNVYIF
jgi:hypothetical protein